MNVATILKIDGAQQGVARSRGRWVVWGDTPGLGFLVGERLAVTNRHWLIDGQVRTCADAKVEQVHLPDSPHTDIALLRLAGPAAGIPLRLGYPILMCIGDRVWVDGPQHGIVDKFESFPEHAVHLVKVGLPPSGSGGPLRNDLGEVVGIVTVNPDQAATENLGVRADRRRPGAAADRGRLRQTADGKGHPRSRRNAPLSRTGGAGVADDSRPARRYRLRALGRAALFVQTARPMEFACLRRHPLPMTNRLAGHGSH